MGRTFGSITIVDTTDIERIYMVYRGSESDTTAPTLDWNSINNNQWKTDITQVTGTYIWQVTVIKQSGIDINSSNWNQFYGDPVCITGPQGIQGPGGATGPTGPTGPTGKGVKSVIIYYYLSSSSSNVTGGSWSTTPQDYPSTGTKYYWTKTITTYTDDTTYESTAVYDRALTNSVKNARDANSTAQAADGKATQALGNADAAVTLATGINQHFWWLESDTSTTGGTLAAGSYITDVLKDTFKSNPGTYGNLLLRSDGVYLNLGLQTLASFKSNALIFYNSAGAELGKFGSTGLEMSGTLNIKGGGRIGQDSDNYWKFGDYISYKDHSMAYLLGYGEASIQLGEAGHWRLDKNRIHTGWYQLGDSPEGQLHFDTGAEKNVTYYWDYGMHYPNKAGSGNNKFLYIRRSNDSTSTSLSTMKGRIDDDTWWTYKFYVDGDGNVHAPGFYIGDSTTPIGGGAGTVAERLTQGYGSATQPVYFNSNGVPTSTTYALNAAGAKGVVTDLANNTTSTDLPTAAAVASYVTSRGYITSYTDNKVQTSQANTTKIYLAGTQTAGTSTGTLNFDSNVYLTTTAGVLHATTFEGNLSGTATKANQDGDGNVIKSTYLKLSGGNVTGAVTFGSSVSIDELTAGDLVVNRAASFTNNLQANTINGVTVGSNPKFTDNNTTYTFANGTNGFTVTPSGGTAQTVTVTPSIANNVTGSGTSGYLAKFTGGNTIGNGPALGSDTTKFLNNKGEWAVPAGTYTYTLPLAANGTRGGVQIGYTQSGKNYPVQLSSEKMYVNVPWENTTYSAGTGLSLSGNTFSNSGVLSITTTGGTHTAISSKTGAVSFNVPTHTSHLTNDSGFLTNSTLYESQLNWGNTGLSGNVTPMGASLSTEHSANRIAFLNPAAIQIEYTTNGGSSWADSGYTNDDKMWLCTGTTGIAVGQSKSGYSQSTALTTNHWTRITLTGQNGTTGYVYTAPRKLLINMGTAVGVNCVVEYKTGVSNASWQTFGTYSVSGWSGWNDIPLVLGTFGGGTTQTSNNWYLRFTFKVTSTRTDSYKGYSQVLGLRLFGATDWTSASSSNSKGPISSTGHLYSFDVGANATFPAKVTANGGFSGTLTGNVTGTATGNVTSVQYDSTNTKFTYTKNGTNTDIVTIANLKTYLGLGSLAYKSSLSKSDIGLGNVTNNAQVKGLSSGTTSGHLVTWGSDGYTVGDSGISKSNIVSSIKSNTNGQLVLTYADGNDSNPITVKITATTADSAVYADALTTSGTIITNLGTTGNGAAKTYTSGGNIEPGVKGTLGVGFGGTGKTSWTQWGIVYASATDTLAQVTAGASSNSGYLLQSNGAAAPGWIQATNSNTASTIVKRDASGNFSAGTITATLSGSASKLGTADKGSTTKPIYLSGGSPAEASTYAGGTAVTLNGSSKGASTASFYAPTSYGSSSQVLVGGGQNATPTWTDISGIVPSSATNATNATYATYDASEASNTTKVTIANKYIPKSIGTAVGDIIYWSASGTPTRLAKGSNGQVLKLANGVPTWGTDNNDNTWRAIQVNGTDILGTGTSTNKLNLKAGTNVTITNSSGTVTIAATDTDTHNTAYLYAGASNGTANAATTNGNTYLILMDGGTATTRRKISGTQNVSVASDSSGNITITGPDLSGYVTTSAIPANIVNTITTTAGAHTAITSQKGDVSFKVPTTAAHVGIKFGYTTSGNNRAVLQDSSGNLYVTQKDDNSNTTYTLTNALASHKFTWTLTAGGSGSGSTTTTAELVAGTGITLTDDTTNKKITIGCSVTNTDTKNTAGSTDTSSEIYLIGATSQAANPQTYSHDTARVRSNGNFVGSGYEMAISTAMGTTKALMSYNNTFDAIVFSFA